MKLSHRGIIPILGILSILIAAGGWQTLSIKHAAAVLAVQGNLDAIAKQKVEQISRWRSEQLNTAAAIMQLRPLKEAARAYAKKQEPATTAKIAEMLQFVCKGWQYRNAHFVNPEGLVKASLNGVTEWYHEDAAEAVEFALRVRKPIFNDFHLHSNFTEPLAELVVPLFDGDTATSNAVGAIVIQMGAQNNIAPITQQWPIPTNTGEIILVRRENKSVLILNELRFKEGSSLQQKEPLSQSTLPEARAVLGEQGVIRGLDYRGVDVFAALKAIPDTPWYLVAKIDHEEAMAIWRTERNLIIGLIVVTGLFLLTAATAAVFHQIKRKQLAQAAAALRCSEEQIQEHTRELEENEERFRKLFENSAEPGFLIEGGVIIDCNLAGLNALQIISVDQIRKRSFVEFAPPLQPDGTRSVEKIAEMYARAHSLNSHVFEWECARTNGERFLVEMILSTITQKSRLLFHASWRDITERRKAQKRLQGIADFNEKLIAAANQGIVAYDAAGGCVLANEAAARVVGTTKETLLQQNFRFLDAWKTSGLFQTAEDVLATGVPRRQEILYTSTFGKTIWLDGTLSRFLSQGRAHLLVIFDDITEFKHAENTREQLSSIIEMTADFVSTATPDGTVRFLNRAARRFMGMGEKDDIGDLKIDKVHTAKSAELINKIGIPSAIRNGTWLGESEFVDHKGRAIPHSQVVIAHRAKSGAVEMLSTIARDQSAQKQIEKIMEARIHILEKAGNSSVDEFLSFCLDEIEIQTESKIGFFHFVDADENTLLLQAWSSNTLKNMCTAEGKGQHYPVAKAGIWCDCVRFRRPIIHNDYQAVGKPGALPPGHAKLSRELVLPLLRNKKIVAIIGVGNKPFDYDERDIEVAQLLGDFAWEVLEKKRAEEKRTTV